MRKPDEIRIRPLKPADLPQVKALIDAVWAEHLGSHPESSMRDLITPESLSDLDEGARIYAPPDGLFLVALSFGNPVATAAFARLDAETAELRRMFVHPDHRRRGLARTLALTLRDVAHGAGYRRLRLGTNRLLSASHSLYYNLGFHDIPSYEPDGERDAIYMELDLSVLDPATPSL